MSTVDRLLALSIPEPNSGCWLWLGVVERGGYGQIRIDGKTRRAHRVAYEAIHGPVPAGLELDHKCRVRCCVNPEHLEAVTRLENIQRARPFRKSPFGDGGRKFGGMQRAKTHCPRGHPYDEANTKWYQGRRYCRACRGDLP